MNQDLMKVAQIAEKLAVKSRLQDLATLLANSEAQRITSFAAVVESLSAGAYIIGVGPYAQGVHSVMSEETVLGRLATPMEQPLDKPVDVFCQDNCTLTPREVSRYHAAISRLGESHPSFAIRDLGSTCGTFVNGKRLGTNEEYSHVLTTGDVISLGSSHINCYLFLNKIADNESNSSAAGLSHE